MTKWVRGLLIANIVIFFAQMTLGEQFTMAFALVPSVALTHPWTIVTYMFLHDPYGFSHILFNMLGLWIFGTPVESRLGPNRFASLYFLSGLGGAAFSFMFARHTPVIGASAAIYGVMLAYAYYWPRDRIMIWGIIPVEARVLVIIYTLISLFGGVTGGGTTAHFAHLGGFAFGFLYLRYLDASTGSKRFRRAVAPKIPERALTNWKKVDPKTVHEVNRDELNRVLDKVSKSGLGSLTPEEKRFLMTFVPPDDRPPMVS